MLEVELIDSMGDDLRVANVARVSFNKWKEEFDQKDAKLINYLIDNEHTSPLRYVQISLRCKAPVFLARQLGKHQVGLSWNEVSRRYVDAGIEFYIPDVWRSRPDGSVKQGSGTDLYDQDFCKEAYSYSVMKSLEVYEDLLDNGVAPEMARMVLPQSMMTSWVWTGSLLSFFYLYRLRIDGHAQKEAQDFAQLVEDVVASLFPHCWKALKGDSNDTETN